MVARGNIKIDSILLTIAEHYGVEREDILSTRQYSSLVRYRQIAMYLSRTLTWHSSPEIGRALNRNHTTVLNAVRKIEALMQIDDALKTEIDSLSARCASRVRPRRVA